MNRAGKKTSRKTGLNLSREKIVQVSLVVKDAAKVAKRFTQIFGISWRLFDLKPGQIVLHGKTIIDANCSLRVAVGNMGGRSLKLVQPVSGQSSYADFLQKSGEGIYTIGFGSLEYHDDAVKALKKAGIALEMQGDGGNGARFSILDTTEELGCRIEFSGPADSTSEPNIKQTGILFAGGSSFVELQKPIFAGGKRINQIGIVLKDEKKAAKMFKDLLGIDGWSFSYGPPGLTDAFLNEKPVPKSAMKSLDVAFANGWLGDLQIELIRPIGLRPGGCHQQFLDKRGNGIQHLSFGVQADYEAVVEGMKRADIGAEFSASLRFGKRGGVSVSYFASQDQLGGFQLEVVGRW
jgi:hypothetical protein